MNLKDFIRSIPDYPKKGILFRDITTLIKDEKAFSETINQIVEKSKKIQFDKIAAIESRGFVFASAVSYILNKPFIMFMRITPKNWYFLLKSSVLNNKKIEFISLKLLFIFT